MDFCHYRKRSTSDVKSWTKGGLEHLEGAVDGRSLVIFLTYPPVKSLTIWGLHVLKLIVRPLDCFIDIINLINK